MYALVVLRSQLQGVIPAHEEGRRERRERARGSNAHQCHGIAVLTHLLAVQVPEAREGASPSHLETLSAHAP